MERTISNLLTEKRAEFMKLLKENTEGEPRTSWDNVLDGLLMWFEIYCSDETSEFLDEKYNSGEIDDNEILWEFEQFIVYAEDINDYDKED